MELRTVGTWAQPEPPRNEGVVDYRTWLRRQHVFWVVQAESAQVEFRAARGWHPLAMGDAWRQTLAKRYAEQLSPRHAGLLAGMLLGEQGAIDPVDREVYAGLGLGHLLTISGLHVSVIVATWLWIMARFKMLRPIRYAITGVLLLVFVLLTGGSVPVVRAAIAGGISLWFAYHRRWRDAPSIVALGAWLMLVWEPYLLLNVSYQLSVAVTFGIVAFVPRVMVWLPERWPVLVRGALAVAGVAQAVSFPLQIQAFNEVSLLALPLNLVVVPFVTYVVTPLGYAALVVPLRGLLEPLLTSLDVVLAALHRPLWLRIVWASPVWGWVLGYYAALAAALAPVPGFAAWRLAPALQRLAAWRIRAALALPLALLVGFAALPPPAERHVYIELLDVGQGDAILLHLPNRRYWLVDAGGIVTIGAPRAPWRTRRTAFDPGADTIVPLLKHRGIRRLDAVVLSHANEDHVLGLQAILANIPVRRVLFNGSINRSTKIRALYQAIFAAHIPMQAVRTGDTWPIGAHARITVLNPARTPPFHTADQNPYSLALYIHFSPNATALLTGDLDASTEASVLHAANRLRLSSRPLTLLKVAHHGSRFASTAPFLARFQPRLAAISVGRRNRYGHPNPLALARLQAAHAAITRTDVFGAIHVRFGAHCTTVYTKLPGNK
jgi:competence protein ComEC